ncbi:MAG: iron-containing alcohol dehydrogenase [Planctomycetota bacterium]|jgi:alcohol dehydrogenase
MNLLKAFAFELPTVVRFGPGVVSELPQVLKEKNLNRALLVTDKGIAQSGLLERITGSLKKGQIEFEIFDSVEPNPKDYNVADGTSAAKSIDADCIVAVGGGSPIDCAKAVAVLATYGGKPRHYAGPGKITGRVLPVIAIPTTAGSASEVTFSAVITDSEERTKFSYRSTRIAPVYTFADPEMTVTMPPPLTAATGMDALTHAVEAYTATEAEPISDAAALYAIELVSKHLKAAFDDGENLEARSGMLVGSILAGIAFSHSDVASVHCLAESLGGMYDLPHGVCNAVILPVMMEYCMDYCAEKYARIAGAMEIGFSDSDDGARKAVAFVKKLACDVKLPAFSSLGVEESDFEELAEKSEKNGSNKSNPRPMKKEDYLEILRMLKTAR